MKKRAQERRSQGEKTGLDRVGLSARIGLGFQIRFGYSRHVHVLGVMRLPGRGLVPRLVSLGLGSVLGSYS
jgi:hypothetical protein